MARTALVLDGGSSPAVACVRSLGRAGFRVLVQENTRAARSRYAATALPVPDAVSQPDRFVELLERVCVEWSIDAVVPCTDVEIELCWQHVDRLGGAAVVGGDRRSVERFLDKAETLAAAEAVGFGVPDWRAPTTSVEVVEAAAELGFPCVVKARRTYARLGERFVQRRYFVVRNRDEARVAADRLGRDGTVPIVEAFVPGRSLAVTSVVDGGRTVAGVAREALTFYPISGGASCWRRTVAPDDVGVAEAFTLLEAVGYFGLGEVEYQVVDGRPHLMEIGVRAHGWLSLAIAAGVDLPLIGARAALGEPLDAADGPAWQVGVEMRSPGGELSRLREALDPRVTLPATYTRRGVVAKAWPPWRPGMRYDHVDFGDLGPWAPRFVRR